MNTRSPPPPLALIAGPTASGKSALALRLAEIAGGTVINADSAQVYRDLRILTARPSPAEEERAPHALYGTIDGSEACSAPRWAAGARTAIAAAHADGRLPILAGGTGLYLRTLLDGIAPLPPIDPAVREEVRALPVAAAHAALAQEDPAAARRLNAGDTTRIARALEVVRSTGRPLAAWQAARSGGIRDTVRLIPLVLLPPRDLLRARCDRRFAAMLDAGAADEVAALAARGLDPALPVMRAIGVREIMAWQAGALSHATMIERAQAATRQYAKRQQTWFAHQMPPTWKRITSQLDDRESRKLAIMLRHKALTG